jgi:hypothetical protein
VVDGRPFCGPVLPSAQRAQGCRRYQHHGGLEQVQKAATGVISGVKVVVKAPFGT